MALISFEESQHKFNGLATPFKDQNDVNLFVRYQGNYEGGEIEGFLIIGRHILFLLGKLVAELS